MTETAAERANTFVESLGDVQVDSTSRNATYAKVGLALQIIGAAAAIVALILSQSTDNPLNQSSAISLGIAGLALVGVGGFVFLRYSFGQFLRFWLLRLSYEQSQRP